MKLSALFESMDRELERVRELLSILKDQRCLKEELDREIGDTQSEVIRSMTGLEATKKGVRFEYEGADLCGVVVQGHRKPQYDTPALVQYLRDQGQFQRVSTRVLDPLKLEAALAAGDIDPAALARFELPAEPLAPYVKFVPPKKESL